MGVLITRIIVYWALFLGPPLVVTPIYLHTCTCIYTYGRIPIHLMSIYILCIYLRICPVICSFQGFFSEQSLINQSPRYSKFWSLPQLHAAEAFESRFARSHAPSNCPYHAWGLRCPANMEARIHSQNCRRRFPTTSPTLATLGTSGALSLSL